MKKFFALVAVALVAFSFASCDGDKNKPTDPTKMTFKIEVSNLESQSATITVTPSIDTVAYYWVYASEATLEYYQMTPAEYCADDLEYYKGQGYTYDDLFGKLVVKGTDTYGAQLDPETKYYVYAAVVDKDLKVISEVAVIDFTTPQFELKGTEALTLDGALYHYEFDEEYNEGFLQVMAQIPAKEAVLSFALIVPQADGTFTEANMYEPYASYGYDNYYNYIYSETNEIDLSFISVNFVGSLDANAKKYTFNGYVVCNDGYKYTFSSVADEYVEEEEEGEGEGELAPRRGATKKQVVTRNVKKIAKK